MAGGCSSLGLLVLVGLVPGLTVYSAAILPPPSKVSFSTINLHTALHWTASEMNAPGVGFYVEYSLSKSNRWKHICSNITETMCVINMDKQAVSYGLSLNARVRAISAKAVSEWKFETTNPVEDGYIGPPSISLETVTTQSVSFSMELPKTPYVNSDNVPLPVDSPDLNLKTITKEISISCNEFNRTNNTSSSRWIWNDLEEDTSYNITAYSIYGVCPDCRRSYTAEVVAIRTLSAEESSTAEPEITDTPNVLPAYILAIVLSLVLFLVASCYFLTYMKRRVKHERFKFPQWWDHITTDKTYVCSHRSNEPPEMFDTLKHAPPIHVPSKDERGELLQPKTECKPLQQQQEFEVEIEEYVTHAFIASLKYNLSSSSSCV